MISDILDTNVLLRFLVGDNTAQKKQAEQWFKEEFFLSQRWLQVAERDTLLSLWKWYREGLHFVDSFLLAWARCNDGRVLTFDKELLSLK